MTISYISSSRMIDIPVFIVCLMSVRAHMCNEAVPKLNKMFNNVSIHPAVDSSHIKLNDTRISPYARYHISHALELDLAHLSSMGAIGCYLSHMELWHKVIHTNTPMIIMEDDVPIDELFLRKALSDIPSDLDHAALVYFPWVGSADCDDIWCKPVNRNSVFGTQMYYITPRGASILLENALPIFAPVDIYITYVANTNNQFRSAFYKSSYFPFYQPLVQEMQSTIGRRISIKKIFMPESNVYYVMFIIICAVAYIRPNMRCECKTKHKKKKELDV